MEQSLQRKVIECLEAVCFGNRAHAIQIFDDLETQAFIEGYEDERCLIRCREAVSSQESQSSSTINALNECGLESIDKIKLLLLGVVKDTLDLPMVTKRLADFFPGHELQKDYQYIIELAYQIEHDRRDQVSDSLDELVSAIRTIYHR